jgi:hypothetical protein
MLKLLNPNLRVEVTSSGFNHPGALDPREMNLLSETRNRFYSAYDQPKIRYQYVQPSTLWNARYHLKIFP